MADQAYSYSISNDTLNGLVDSDRLENEITTSEIVVALRSIGIISDNLDITFKAPLSAGDQTILDGIVSSHTGEYYVPVDTVRLGESRDLNGNAVIAIEKPAGDFDTVVTHNWCDNSTWPSPGTNSIWELKPGAGDVYSVVRAEVQFKHDLNISGLLGNDEIYLKYYAWISGVRTVVKTITFSSVVDLFELGNEHYHISTPLPEISTGFSTIVFSYANKLKLYGDDTQGKLSHIEITTKDDNEITGTYATVGFVIQ